MDDEIPPPEITWEQRRVLKRAAKHAKQLAKRAARKEERRLKTLQLRRELLKREEAYGKISYKRAADGWTKMMTEIRQKELKDELQVLWDTVQSNLDARDNHIDRLIEDNGHAQEQFLKCSDEHLRFLDLAKKYFGLFINTIRDTYEQEAHNMLTEFHKENIFVNYISKRNQRAFENILHGYNSIHHTNLDNLFTENSIRERDSHFITDELIREDVVSHMSRMHSLMLATVRVWRRDAASQRKMTALFQQCHSDDVFINHNQGLINALEAERDRLTKQMYREMRDNARQLALDTQEKQYFVECLQQIQQKYTSDLNNDDRNLRRAMGAVHKSIADLLALERKGGLLLEVAAACTKLLTEREKSPAMYEKIDDHDHDDASGDGSSDGEDHEHDVETLMRPFKRRIAIARCDNVALQEEKEFLLKDNARLTDLLRTYCTQLDYERCIATLRIGGAEKAGPSAQEANHLVWNRQVDRNSSKK